jgi:hypothetical protein
MRLRSTAILVPAFVGLMFAQTAQPIAPKIAPGTPAVKAAEPPPSTLPESTVVLSVGDEKMTRQQFEDLVKAMPQQIRQQATGPAKRQMAEKLAEVEALSQEARKRKVDERPEAKQITQFQVDSMLAGFLYQDILAAAVPDEAAVKAYYEAHKQDYEEVKTSHILIRFKGSPVPTPKDGKDLTPEEALAKAQEIHKKLAAGADFAELAKTESDDKGSGANGGELGDFITREQLVPEFSNVAFSLPIGQISEPIKTRFGYHIIKVKERRNKSLEDVRKAIEDKLKPEIAQKKVEEIRKQYATVVNDEFFGPKVAPAAPPTLAPPSK